MNYDTLATEEVVSATAEALKAKGYEVFIIGSGAEAFSKIKELIPAGASVMNGSSVTLEQIGFVDYLKAGQHGWNNLHAAIVAEKDTAKQSALRRQALLSEYYLGSVHAMAQTGEFLIASNSGSQLPHIVFSSSNLIFVVGTQKIVPDLTVAMKRLHEYVMPLEEKHMQEKYGAHTADNKIVLFKGENRMSGRKVRIILVSEKLGF